MKKGEQLGDRVKSRREQLGISQQKLAELAGLSQMTISLIESNKNKSTRNLFQLADALAVDARWLATGGHEIFKSKPIDKE